MKWGNIRIKMIKSHKRKKVSRMHGKGMGSHGWGARKKHRKSGHKGGKGMSGSGKRGDQKKTLVNKKYGHKYFGKQGITSKKTKRDIRQRINLQQIELNLEKYGKKSGDKWESNLKNYKILGTGEVKNKLIITAQAFSETAKKKIENQGGQAKETSKSAMQATKLPTSSAEASSDDRKKVKATGGDILLKKSA